MQTASTRGDGIKGFDVTRHVCNIPSIPFQLPDGEREDIIVRGELIINKEAWVKCKEELEENIWEYMNRAFEQQQDGDLIDSYVEEIEEI